MNGEALDEAHDGTVWKPGLARHVMLRNDPVRATELLLMPERVVVLRGMAGDILRLCDGSRRVSEIVEELLRRHPGAPVEHDVWRFLDRVRTEGWLR